MSINKFDVNKSISFLITITLLLIMSTIDYVAISLKNLLPINNDPLLLLYLFATAFIIPTIFIIYGKVYLHGRYDFAPSSRLSVRAFTCIGFFNLFLMGSFIGLADEWESAKNFDSIVGILIYICIHVFISCMAIFYLFKLVQWYRYKEPNLG